jgi:hypothetical protein
MTSPSKPALIVGWILSIIPAGMLLMSAAMKFAHPPFVTEGNAHLGWPDRLALPLGIVEAACAFLFLIPHTAVLGAILVTGYLGGAISAHVRIGEPVYIQAALATLPWVALYLRDPRLRSLAPLRRKTA